MFNYIPQEESDADPPNEVPLAFSFLTVADELDPYEKEFVVEACRQPVSFWSVQEVDQGTSLKLRDLFTQSEHIVRERQASEVLKKGDIVYTRVISLGQTVEAEIKDIDGTLVRVATPAALYRLKKGTVRLQDQADAAALRERFNLSDEK